MALISGSLVAIVGGLSWVTSLFQNPTLRKILIITGLFLDSGVEGATGFSLVGGFLSFAFSTIFGFNVYIPSWSIEVVQASVWFYIWFQSV